MPTVTLEVLTGPDYQIDDDGWENNTYQIRLTCMGRYMDTEWHQGLAITDDPTAESVLENLLSTAQGFDCDPSFEEWAGDYGYDTDSRKAERMFDACKAEADRVRWLIGVSNWDRLGSYDDTEAAARELSA